MSKRRSLLFASAWLLCAAGPAPHKEVSLCADVWCPYNCGPDAKLPGFAVEIARQVFGQAGYVVTYQPAGWARCIEDARAGRFSGIIGAIRADAPDFTFPHQSIGNSQTAYGIRMGDPFRYTGPQALEGHVLATVGSYKFNGETGAYLAKHTIDDKSVEFVSGENAIEKNLKKLLAGRVDLVLDDENVLRGKIASLGLDDKIDVVRGQRATPLYIAFSPASPDRQTLSDILDRGLAGLRANGALAALLARYHVRDGT